MKLLFEFDIEKKKIVFFGNGFEISGPAETYEDISSFAKDIIENDICIPSLKHRQRECKHIEIPIKADISLPVFDMCMNMCLSLFESDKDKEILDTMIKTIKKEYDEQGG